MLGFALMARELAWRRAYPLSPRYSPGFEPAPRDDPTYLHNLEMWPATTEYYKIIDRAERMQRLLAIIPCPVAPWRLHL